MLKEQIDLLMQKLRGILSNKELEVLMLYTDGLSYSAIAQRLGISEKSVDNFPAKSEEKDSKAALVFAEH